VTSSFDAERFVSPDGPGGFLRGTLIKSPDGDRPVETLVRGERILSRDGRQLPVVWLGRREVTSSDDRRLDLLPVCILASALDHRVPSRDLLVSPYHAILMNNVLVQAGALVNGLSVRRQTDAPAVFTYYSIELDSHDLVMAEDAPAESFMDNLGREIFDNGDEHRALFPNGKPIEPMPYPRARSYRQLPRRIRSSIAERAKTFES
jgi:hypothetical protein